MTHEATHSSLDVGATVVGATDVVVPARATRAPSAVRRSPATPDDARLQSELAAVLADCQSEPEATVRWLTLVGRSLQAPYAALYGVRHAVSPSNGATSGDALADEPLLSVGHTRDALPVAKEAEGAVHAAASGGLARALPALARKAAADGIVQFARVGRDLGQWAAAVPIMRTDAAPEVLLVWFDSAAPESSVLLHVARELQLYASFAGTWRGRWLTLRAARPPLDATDGETPLSSVSPATPLISPLSSPSASPHRDAHPDASPETQPATRPDEFHDALLKALSDTAEAKSLEEVAGWWCRLAADRLALPSLSAGGPSSLRMVAIGRVRRGGACRLLAVAPERTFSASAPLVGGLEAVMAETVLRAGDEAGGRPDRRATQAMQQLRELSGAPHIRPLSLRDAVGRVRGSCLLLTDRAWSDEEWARCEAWGRLAGVHLGLAEAAAGWLPAHRLHRWRRLSVRQRLRAASIAVALSSLLLFVPLPCRIACRGDLQPSDRRVVVAPQEARLEEALVKPGDSVEAGQLLARFDGRDLRLELGSLEAERGRAAGERDRAMAAGDVAASQLASLELRRLDLKRQLLESRLAQLEVRSPIAGQVIGGDLRVWQGSRLTQGQSLVEIAAPGTLVLELSIPDADIDRAIVGKTVHCRLESLPQVSLTGTLRSIRPRAELRDGENVFVGLVDLRIPADGDVADLRPGMRGRVRLEAEPRTLAWQMFHRAWEQVRFRGGW